MVDQKIHSGDIFAKFKEYFKKASKLWFKT